MLSEEDVGVETVTHHADLVAPQPKLGGDVGQHELGWLPYHRGLPLGGACDRFADSKQRPPPPEFAFKVLHRRQS